MQPSNAALDVRQFSITDHLRTTPTRWPFVKTVEPAIIDHALQAESHASSGPSLQTATAQTSSIKQTLDIRQFSPNQPRTTPTRWPFVAMEVISTSDQLRQTLKITPTPTPTPTFIDKQVYGAPCPSEGQWLCVGSSYQRCDLGQWSHDIPLVAGMSCTAYGIGNDNSSNSGSDSGASPSTSSCGSSKKGFLIIALMAGAVIGAWI